jgi:superfamily II DNA or RNA helicase
MSVRVASRAKLDSYNYMTGKNVRIDCIVDVQKKDRVVYATPLYYARTVLGEDNDDLHELGQLRMRMSSKLVYKKLQEEVIQDIYDCLMRHRVAKLTARCGFGKTLISLSVAAKLGMTTLIMCPMTMLCDQFFETVRQHVRNVNVEIVPPDGSVEGADIYIAYSKRVSKMPYSVRRSIGFLIIDESHRMCTEGNILEMCSITPWGILALSGTPKQNSKYGIIEHFAGKYGHDTEIVVKGDIATNLIRICIPVVGEERIITRPDGQTVLNYTHMQSSMMEDEEYIRIICKLARKCARAGRKTIVLNTRRELTEEISERLRDKGISSDYIMGGKTEYDGFVSVLVGIPKMIDTGFDQGPQFSGETKLYDRRFDTMIITTSMSNTSNFQQVMGRIMRSSEKPTLFWLQAQNEIFDRHWVKISKYAKDALGATIRELSVDDLNTDISELFN